jgi:hypothetical protein
MATERMQLTYVKTALEAIFLSPLLSTSPRIMRTCAVISLPVNCCFSLEVICQAPLSSTIPPFPPRSPSSTISSAHTLRTLNIRSPHLKLIFLSLLSTPPYPHHHPDAPHHHLDTIFSTHTLYLPYPLVSLPRQIWNFTVLGMKSEAGRRRVRQNAVGRGAGGRGGKGKQGKARGSKRKQEASDSLRKSILI